MVWPPQNVPLFRYKTPCCACCSFAIPQDVTLGVTPEYANATDAQNALNDEVRECSVYSEISPSNYDSFTVTPGMDSLSIAYDYQLLCGTPPPGPPPPPCAITLNQWASINTPGGTISVPYSVAATGGPSSAVSDLVEITVYNESYSVVTTASDATQGDTSGTFSISVPAGHYFIKVSVVRAFTQPGAGDPLITASFDFAFPGATQICPVTSLYDDGSGGTAVLECGTCTVIDCLSVSTDSLGLHLTGHLVFNGDGTVDVDLTFSNTDVTGTVDVVAPSGGGAFNVKVRAAIPLGPAGPGDCAIFDVTYTIPGSNVISQPFTWPPSCMVLDFSAACFGDTCLGFLDITNLGGSGETSHSDAQITPDSPASGTDCTGQVTDADGIEAVRARATITKLVVGLTYDCIISIEERAAGSSDPWVVTSSAVVNFVAATETETTPYVDLIPSTWDVEFRTSSCLVQIE